MFDLARPLPVALDRYGDQERDFVLAIEKDRVKDDRASIIGAGNAYATTESVDRQAFDFFRTIYD